MKEQTNPDHGILSQRISCRTCFGQPKNDLSNFNIRKYEGIKEVAYLEPSTEQMQFLPQIDMKQREGGIDLRAVTIKANI